MYRGVLTPQELDAPEAETAALASGAAIHDLGWMRRVAVRGDDRFRWLSGMVTNTVNDLFPNTGAWNLVLNAQGRIQGDLTVWREENERDAGSVRDLERRLPAIDSRFSDQRTAGSPEQFIIMDDVELVPLGEQVGEAGSETAIGLTGPQAGEVLERVGLPALADPMTGTSVEWNGWTCGFCAATACWRSTTSSGCRRRDWRKLWSCLRTGGATPVGRDRWRHFALPKGFRLTASTWWSATCRRRPRRCGRCTSARAATWARRLWSASARAAMCTGICGRWSWPGRCRRAGAELTLGRMAQCRTDHQRGRVAAGGRDAASLRWA